MKKTNLENTTHNLNNILTSIGLSADLLEKEIYGKLNASQRKQIKLIASEVKKLKKGLAKLR